jgi:hypothetical protein
MILTIETELEERHFTKLSDRQNARKSVKLFKHEEKQHQP